MRARARPDKQQKVRGRRRARLMMRILTGMCALGALGIGATQLTSKGLEAFVDRPAGVGATPPEGAAPAPRRAAPTPNEGATPEPAPRPEAPPEHPPRPHGHHGPRDEPPGPRFPHRPPDAMR